MGSDDILILNGRDVLTLLAGRELELIEVVREAYLAHADGASSLPHSTFLRFPAQPQNRIIALPAYLGEKFDVAGLKWIASFPDNLQQNLERASAVIILNSAQTGRPEAFIEGSIISAKRTAASAALAALTLQPNRPISSLGLIGCGVINFEVARFILAACTGVGRFVIYDLDAARAQRFTEKCRRLSEQVTVETAPDTRSLLRESAVVSLATTAATPHIFDLSACAPGSTILHLSLRDLSPAVILACDNVVDDVGHVCRAQTSLHLTEQQTGNRNFIRCTLADILGQQVAARRDEESVAVFSPFGLGVLDLAVASRVRKHAVAQERGIIISSFLPDTWGDREVT